jgi:ABC-type uncharacterized transport system permease subunit
MANSFFDWVVSLTRFVKIDIIRAEDLNAAFDEVSAGFEEVETLTDSAIKVPSGEDALTLSAAATRKGKFLTFNSTTGVAETDVSVDGYIAQVEASAAASAASAADSADSAATAESFAQMAILTPGTSATSTTSMTIGVGSKTFTIEAGKSLVPGMKVIVAVTASPDIYMWGTLISYSDTTAIVNVLAAQGAGTYAAWTMSLSAHSGVLYETGYAIGLY